MMKQFSSSRYLYIAVINLILLSTGVYPQQKDVVLAAGEPPLTRSMVVKTHDFLEWVLDIDLTPEHKAQIQEIAVRAWKEKSAEEMESTINIAGVQDNLVKMSAEEREFQKSQIRPAVLDNLRKDISDEMSRTLVALYEAKHSSKPPISHQLATPTPAGKQKRVGTDGFTGIYRMVRPRAININNSGYEPGYWIEYITFLPGGYAYWSLPPEGLLNYDPMLMKQTDPDDFGTYKIENGEIHVLRGPRKQLYVITRTGDRLNNPPSLGKGTFRRVPVIDNLRLEGNYRRGDTEPGISFSPDGTFRDQGILANFGTGQRPDGTTYQHQGPGGTGTYIIDQNTLELRYSDGRVKRLPFIAFPENLAKAPALDSFILIREEYMKRF